MSRDTPPFPRTYWDQRYTDQMTTPREDAIAEVRSNWPDDYTPAEAKAWIAACDRIEFALDAAAETPDPQRRWHRCEYPGCGLWHDSRDEVIP